MNTHNTIVEIARKVIKNQSKAINNLADFVDDEFAKATELIFNSKGRVVVTGVGKSAIIANKIVATLNSTGTPSIFLHAADAIHGDIGIIQKDDIVVCISKSGNTPEVKVLLPLIKNSDNKVISITSNPDSYLAKNSDFVLNSYVEKEACPHNLAPTTSTTAQLVLGDALAICLLDLRGFSKEDFAKFHPGGSLGKRLYLRVNDISSVNMKPRVSPEDNLKTVIVEISEKMLGITAVVENNKIIGVITDGDIRRMLNKYDIINDLKARDIMSANPKAIKSSAMAVDALELMELNEISQLLVESNGEYAGVIHLHDLIKEGII